MYRIQTVVCLLNKGMFDEMVQKLLFRCLCPSSQWFIRTGSWAVAFFFFFISLFFPQWWTTEWLKCSTLGFRPIVINVSFWIADYFLLGSIIAEEKKRKKKKRKAKQIQVGKKLTNFKSRCYGNEKRLETALFSVQVSTSAKSDVLIEKLIVFHKPSAVI